MSSTHRNIMYEGILVVDAFYDKIENLIQDAERHRRTPRLPAISGKAIDVCFFFLGCGRFNARRWQKFGDAAITVLPNFGTKKLKQFD